jgi:hypothetical protein
MKIRSANIELFVSCVLPVRQTDNKILIGAALRCERAKPNSPQQMLRSYGYVNLSR